ncbi:MAG TPA: C40 family peptidase, partial [Chloroflexia bacterium]|nr:C40 family peptidase [Chloroflexia bacterium]
IVTAPAPQAIVAEKPVAKPAAPVAEKPAAAQPAPVAVAVSGAPAAVPAAPAAAVQAPASSVVAPKPETPAETDARSATSRGEEPSAESAAVARGNSIVNNAMRYVGYRYRFGGTSPSGFDCSGFVYYVANKSGVRVGRDMYSQLNSGPRVSRSNLRPGDLVFFSNTYKRGLSHAGIYIGNGKFVHAENESTGVTVSSLNTSYWAAHYSAASRPR